MALFPCMTRAARKASLPLYLPGPSSLQSNQGEKTNQVLFYKTFLMQLHWELAPALTEGLGFSGFFHKAYRKRTQNSHHQSYLAPHEGLVGGANDEIGPDDMQDLQGYQKAIEEPPWRIGANQLPAFKEGCVQNPRRDPETHYRSVVLVTRLPALN